MKFVKMAHTYYNLDRALSVKILEEPEPYYHHERWAMIWYGNQDTVSFFTAEAAQKLEAALAQQAEEAVIASGWR